MPKINSNSITFVDITDSRKLDVYISSNLPTTQIYDSNTGTYSPDWSIANLQLNADVYLDSEKIMPETIKWYIKINGSESEVNNKSSNLLIKTNVLSDNPIITYKCIATYQGIEAFSEVTFMRADTGKDGTSVKILGSYNTLTELQSAHPTGNTGDSYIVDGDLYVWATNNSRWENVGNLQGPKGDRGESAKAIILNASAQVFKVSKTGAISPSTITVVAQSVNTNINNWTYSTNGGESFLSTVPTGVSINGNTVTITGSNLTSNSIVIKASDGTYSDTLTIYKVFDGSDGAKGNDGASAPIVFLTNENITFGANEKGQISSTSFTTNVVAYNGTTQVVPTIGTITGLPTGMTLSSSTTSGNEVALSFTIANNSTLGSTSNNNGTINIPITSPIGTNLKLSWSKVNSGANGVEGKAGADAYTVLLTNESHAFAGDIENAIAGSASTQVIAYKGSASQSVTIVSVNGMNAATTDTATGITGLRFQCSALSGTSPTITFICTTDFKSANGSIPIVLSVSGVTFTKMFTYSIAFKGDKGEPGEAGTAASSYWLISSANVVQKTSTGIITVTPSTLTFTGKRQTGAESPIDYACRWKIAYSTDGTNYTDLYTSTVDEKSKSIATATTYKTMRVRMYMAGGTTTLLDEQIIPTVTDGTKGDTGIGINSVTVTYGVSTSASTQPTSWQTSIPAVAEGSYLWTRTVTDYTDDTIPDTVTLTYAKQGVKGDTGSQGSSVTISSIQYQAGTSATTAPTGTWSNNVVEVAEGSYLWTKTAFSDNKVAYGVAKQGAKGSTGASAVTFQIYSSNGYLLTKDISTLTLQTFAYEGSTAITSGATYQWSQFIDGIWTVISGATSATYTITQADVLKAKSYRCVMTYKSQTYTSTVTVQDKTDVYNSIMCISSNTTNNNCYWVLYTLVYSDAEEVDPLLGSISITAPTSPTSGDYWYAVDEVNATVTLKKYNGTSWVNSTDTQSLSYYWDIIDNGSKQAPLGASSKVKIISCRDFTATATLVCEVSNVEDGLLTQSSLSLTDASDPIVSETEPTATVNGQIWIKPNGNGTYLMFVWDESLNNWISSDMDTRSKVYTSRPTSYNVGDLWITASDTDHGSYLHGTLLQAQKTNTTYSASDWSPTLRYDQDIDDMKETLNNLSQYVTITSAGLRIGARGVTGELSPFTSLFTSTELSFYQNSEKLLTLANNKLTAPRIEVEDDLVVQGSISLGNLKLIIESNGSFSFAVQK